MISLSEEMISGLNERCIDWSIGNVPELDTPVMIVANYAPSYDLPSLSIAFDMAGQAKCWLSVPKVREINGQAPSRHDDYRNFCHKETSYYPYSIRPLEQTVFQDANELYRVCWILYQHAVFD